MKKEKIDSEEYIDLSLLNEGQLQCLAEEFEAMLCKFYGIKSQEKPP